MDNMTDADSATLAVRGYRELAELTPRLLAG
jgi:hypothetical protein